MLYKSLKMKKGIFKSMKKGIKVKICVAFTNFNHKLQFTCNIL